MVPSGGRVRLTITLICCYIPFLCPLLFAQAHLHKPFPKHSAIGKRDALSDSGLTTASWIWTAAPTTGNVAFLRTVNSPAGKTASTATISMTAVNQATVWVNGQPIGATAKGANTWQTADVFSAGLNATGNIFAVLAVNNADSGAPAPGFLAAIKIVYADGSSDTVVSDASWTVSPVIPPKFPTPADTSNFLPATVAALFGSGPWGSSVTVSAPAPASAILSGSDWIWSTAAAATGAATGSVGFRTSVATPGGKVAQSATVLMTADNGFQLYVNGAYIGQSPGVPTVPNFAIAQQFTVALDSASNVFNVIASNIAAAGAANAGPAGLAGSITITFSDGTTSVVVTDNTWLTGPFTTALQFIATPDTALTKSFSLGAMGVQPWGALTGISNALAAPQVPAGPFVSGTVPTVSSASAGASSASLASVTGSSTSSAGPTSASTPVAGDLGSTSTSAPASTASAGLAGDTNKTNTNSAPSTSHGISTSAIIAIVVVVLALIGLVGVFWWRRGRKKSVRHSMGRELFDAANGVGQSGGSSQPSASQRTSMTSAAHAEMVTVQPQQPAYMYNYPRPPVMAQAAYMPPSPISQGYPQPPVGYGYPQPQAQQPLVSQGYPQPPPVAYPQQPSVVQIYPQQALVGQGYPQPPSSTGLGHPGNANRLVVVGEPLSPTSPMLQQQQMPRRQSTQSTQSSQLTAAPPSKLDREEMYWRNNAAGSTAGSARSSAVGLSYASSSAAGPSGAQSRPTSLSVDDAYGGMDDPDTFAPPPSYSVHMQ
ncbi:hypothetical protein B0H12DRAFT_1124212 [Mycena haematopus]|nr:hypothetical protein B0H12DRAFT_1124212 [Mycena haematopus]